MKGVVKSKVGLKAKLDRPSGGKSDHYTVKPLHFAVKTHAFSIPIEYYNLPDIISGKIIEIISGTKSLDNPSIFVCRKVNGIELYSLPDNTCDTIAITDGVVSIEKKCGHAIIDGNTQITAIIKSGDTRVANGYFAIGYTKTTFNDLIEPQTTNVYCNRLSVSKQKTLTAVSDTAIYINNVQALYIVLPTGTCDENSASIAAWLNKHKVEIVYPIAIITANDEEETE
jgi:hypothetical protein